MKKNEIEEITEEQLADIKADSDANKIKKASLEKKIAKFGDKCTQINQSTDKSLDVVKNELKNRFAPNILVVKHDTKL